MKPITKVLGILILAIIAGLIVEYFPINKGINNDVGAFIKLDGPIHSNGGSSYICEDGKIIRSGYISARLDKSLLEKIKNEFGSNYVAKKLSIWIGNEVGELSDSFEYFGGLTPASMDDDTVLALLKRVTHYLDINSNIFSVTQANSSNDEKIIPWDFDEIFKLPKFTAYSFSHALTEEVYNFKDYSCL